MFDTALAKDLDDVVREHVELESAPAKFTLLYLYRDRLEKDYALSLMNDLEKVANRVNLNATEDKPRSVLGYIETWKNEMELN